MRLVKALALTGLALLFACQTTPPAVIPQTPILQVPQIPSGPPPKPNCATPSSPPRAQSGCAGGCRSLEKEDIFDFGVLNAVTGMGFAKGDKLEAWVKGHIKTTNIEQMKIPFAAVAADLNWGYKVVLDKGSVARAIRASAAIPGVFQPVQHQGKILVDGGVVDNIPISVAKAKGADLVIAVDISSNLGNPNITNLLGVSLQATNIMFALNVEQAADVLIAPAGIGDVGMLDFTQKKRCMQAGIDATKESMPRIRQAIDTWVAARTRPASTTP